MVKVMDSNLQVQVRTPAGPTRDNRICAVTYYFIILLDLTSLYPQFRSRKLNESCGISFSVPTPNNA